MSDIPSSHENKASASIQTQAVPVKSDQPANENTAKKDVSTRFRDAEERIAKMTPEERREHLHSLGLEEGYSSVDPMTAMMVLEKVCYGEDDEEVHDTVGEGSGTADVNIKS